MNTIPITKRGVEVLEEELHRLKTKKRLAVVNAIAKARAQGDLSENADYDAAKERQGFVGGHIREIKSKLSAAQIISPTLLDADSRVVSGAAIDLEGLDSDKPTTYQIAGDDEANLETDKTSISSSITRILVSKFGDDVVTVVAPGGEREYEVLAVKYL